MLIWAPICCATPSTMPPSRVPHSEPSPPITTATNAFVAVVIGGLGSLWGTLLGGIVLGVAQQIGAQINISDELLAGYLVFLLVLIVRPQGLTVRRSQS